MVGCSRGILHTEGLPPRKDTDPAPDPMVKAVECVERASARLRYVIAQGGASVAPDEVKMARDALMAAINSVDKSAQAACRMSRISISYSGEALVRVLASYELPSAPVRSVRLDGPVAGSGEVRRVSFARNAQGRARAAQPYAQGAQGRAHSLRRPAQAGGARAQSAQGRAQGHAQAAKREYRVEDRRFYAAWRRDSRFYRSGTDARGDFIRYTVRRGDSLWLIAKRVFRDAQLWPAIFHDNRDEIENPDLIYPGQLFEFRPKGVLSPEEIARLRDEAIRWDIERRKRKKLAP